MKGEYIMAQIDLREVIETRETFLSRVFCELVKAGYRRDRGNVAYIPINDTLELQFKLNIEDLIKDSKVCIFDDLLERHDICANDLKEIALENTQRMYPARFESFREAIPIPFDIDLPMYILTNNKKTFGAGAILYSGMKEKIESVMGEFIVIPSSVHEVLVLPKFMSGPSIVDIIKEVNKTTVDPLEQLSDVPYKLVDDGELLEIEFAD